MQLAATMIDAGQIEYALVVNGEGARYTQESPWPGSRGPDATAQDVFGEFATLTLGSGAAAMVLGRADQHPEGHRLVGGVARAGTEHHELCVGDLDTCAPTPRGCSRPGWRSSVATVGRAPGRVRLGRTWTATSSTRSRTVHTRALCEALDIDPARVPLTFPPARQHRARPSVPFTLAKQAESLRPGDRVLLHGHRLGPEHLVRRDRLVTARTARRSARPGLSGAAGPRPALVPASSTRPTRDGVRPRLARPGQRRRSRRLGTMLCVHGNPTWSYLWRRLLAAGAGRLAGGRGRPARHGLVRAHRRRGRSPQRVDDLGAPDRRARHRRAGRHRRPRLGRPDLARLGAARTATSSRGVVLTNTAVHQPAGAAGARR